jgi:dTDP-glucose 4,6-dehydratase
MNNTILITGGCGFIGSNFIQYILANTNYRNVINLDKLTYAGNLNNLLDIQKDERYIFIQGDICDHNCVRNIFKEYLPNAVVHFAAESHVDRSIDGPQQFIQTNIIGTSVLLQESVDYYIHLNKSFRAKFKFHHISTDEVFGSLGEGGYFSESTAYDPSSPYSASKASSDHLVRAWHRTFGLPVTISNCSNNYGPYQFPEKLIPLMILNCLAEKPLPVYGTGENVRDWLYVQDHCDAINMVLQKGIVGDTYNVGGNNEIQNIQIVRDICTILDEVKPAESRNSYHQLITFVKDRPGHDFRYAIDSTKIKQDLGWQPHETFKSGLRKTINWYLENKDWWIETQENIYQQERLGTRYE